MNLFKSKVSQKSAEKITTLVVIAFLLFFIFICFKIYVPVNPASAETVTFTVQKGWGQNEIAENLYKMKIISSEGFFKFYSIISLKNFQLQAGDYSLSPRDSIYRIVNKMANGDVIRNNVVVFEGWDVNDIGKYMESRGICTQKYFVALAKKDYSLNYDFLQDKPKNVSLEGYFFPDTYELSKKATCEELVNLMLTNFGKKMTPEIRGEIAKQKKTIFQVVTMASIIEKEVRSLVDKKIVAGILWKRIDAGMPLQLDSTVNYVTGKSDASVTIADTQKDSLYNTYMYKGLPKGPISNPGMNSITAALHPTKTAYWYYLSDGSTIYSKTDEEHAAARIKYLGH